MKKMLCLCCGLAIAMLLSVGCNPDKPTTGTTPPVTSGSANTASTTSVSLNTDVCGKCGNEAGGENCCKEGTEKCDKCGFQKGSMLCCAEGMSSKEGVMYCKDCGHVKDSAACCKDACEECEKCGLHKGSDLCCKIKEKK